MVELKKGNKVELKVKPSPVMVIDDIMDGKATCTWFNNKQELKRDRFDLETLEEHVPASSKPSINSILSGKVID